MRLLLVQIYKTQWSRVVTFLNSAHGYVYRAVNAWLTILQINYSILFNKTWYSTSFKPVTQVLYTVHHKPFPARSHNALVSSRDCQWRRLWSETQLSPAQIAPPWRKYTSPVTDVYSNSNTCTRNTMQHVLLSGWNDMHGRDCDSLFEQREHGVRDVGLAPSSSTNNLSNKTYACTVKYYSVNKRAKVVLRLSNSL